MVLELNIKDQFLNCFEPDMDKFCLKKWKGRYIFSCNSVTVGLVVLPEAVLEETRHSSRLGCSAPVKKG